jgi:hypothetical protein
VHCQSQWQAAGNSIHFLFDYWYLLMSRINLQVYRRYRFSTSPREYSGYRIFLRERRCNGLLASQTWRRRRRIKG